MEMTFIPSLNISGYGDTLKEANDMIDFTLSEYLGELVKQSMKDIKQELLKYGWSSSRIRTKVFEPLTNSTSKMSKKGISDYATTSLTF